MLANRCKKAIEAGVGTILVTLNRELEPGARPRIGGRVGPTGRVFTPTGSGRTLVEYDPIKVLAWMHRSGLIIVEAQVKAAQDA